MSQSFRCMTSELAGKIKLVMTDVDGTLIAGGSTLGPEVVNSFHDLEKRGIKVGLISGRSIPFIDLWAGETGIRGPMVAENGGMARLNGKLLNLGYSREPALKAFKKLKQLFPESITGREDNDYRFVDVVVRSEIPPGKLRTYLDDEVQIIDSGYIMHIMQRQISKGNTLLELLPRLDPVISPEEVMVFGDSPTDASLFELFPHSVLIKNGRQPLSEVKKLQKIACYESEHNYGDGFAEVIAYMLAKRGN
ncbi:MAG: HAD hydrolase family protein [Chloroflexi bacterium]|nr:HAD hydrolase family protein [Chloroflexota bacterium]